ncbi:molecular chaperone [Bordetella petrii]|uniref:fimbrial biogenesis chaperone n=1 Tax=Bordetella petrii TaxID=94624 RepID=UPI001E5195A5|nr:molecular chaperone [Bordetella petrii]MCD0502951.1 molecular chaperone [Bordetella petrii]
MRRPILRTYLSGRLCHGLLALFLGLAGIAPGAALAKVSLSHTRLILSAAKPEANPRVSNEGDRPVLLQLWLDAGDPRADPRHILVPLLVTQPVLRLEPGATQRLRLLYTGRAGPPADRESVYWLNILEIPPKPAGPYADRLQVSFRTRVKVFFRPAAMPAVDIPAHRALRFEYVGQGQGVALRISNPTPLHQTLLEVGIGQGRGTRGARMLAPPDMLEPGASVDLPVGQRPPDGGRVFFSLVDDHGSVVDAQADVAGGAEPR